MIAYSPPHRRGKLLIIVSRCPVPLPLGPVCLSIGAFFYSPVTDPETLFIGAHHCPLDDCSLAQEILPGFGQCKH